MATKQGYLHSVPSAHHGTRRSHRVYTHAVVGFYDWNSRIANASEEAKQWINDRWSYYQSIRNLTHSDEVANTSIEYARNFFQTYGDEYREAIGRKAAELVATYEDRKAKQGELPTVLQWSQSETNAAKALGTWAKRGYRDVHVVPVKRT